MALRILVIDDEPYIRRLLTRLLDCAGYEVDSVEGGKQALRQIREGNRPDLIISDLMMPEMSGTDFVRRLREEESRPVPVMILTARGQEVDAEEARTAGANAFMTKPFSSHELLETVSSLMSAINPKEADPRSEGATGTNG